MSNIIYKDRFYNEEVKRKFLEKYNENTQKTISRIFKAAYQTEKDLGKDLYDFNREQLRLFMYTLRPTKINASRTNGNLISSYIDWAIEEKLKKGTNPLDNVPKEWYDQFVDKEAKQYFTEDQLNDIEQFCKNYQDKVIIRLLREGVGGEGHSEILNLTKDDIDADTNILSLEDDKRGQRKLKVSEICIKYCLEALRETEYQKNNGVVSPDIKSPVIRLVDNNYVVKSALTNTENVKRADKHLVYRRIANISKLINEPHFTPKNIQYSGMLILARDLYLKNGKLDVHELNIIADQFNVPKIKNDEGYNLHRLKEEFLNVGKLKEIYSL